MEMEENKAGDEDGREQCQPSRIVTMAPTNIQIVAMDSLLWISFVFYLTWGGTEQEKKACSMSCKTGSLHGLL